MAKPGKTIPGPELPHTLPVGRVLPDSPPLTRQGAPPRLSTPSCSWSPQEPCQGQTHGQVALPAPPPHPLGAPPPTWGTPLPCTEEHKQPCQTSRRTQPAWNIQNTGSGGTGTGRPDAGAVRGEKVQALLPPFPAWPPCAPADEGRGGAPPVPGPQGAHRIPQHPTQPAHLPTQTRWPGDAQGFGGKTSLQPPCKLSLAAAGG